MQLVQPSFNLPLQLFFLGFPNRFVLGFLVLFGDFERRQGLDNQNQVAQHHVQPRVLGRVAQDTKTPKHVFNNEVAQDTVTHANGQLDLVQRVLREFGSVDFDFTGGNAGDEFASDVLDILANELIDDEAENVVFGTAEEVEGVDESRHHVLGSSRGVLAPVQ